MDAFASPSIRPVGPRARAIRAAEAVLLTAALGLALVSVPGAPNARLDASWQVMLIHAHVAGLQFGRELIFTWGPWGFLCNAYHLGSAAAVPIIAWQTAGQFLVAFCLVALTRGLVLWRRLAFAALLIAFHWIFMDVEYFVLITLIVLSGLLPRDAPLVRMLAWTLLLGFLAQLKFTYFALGSAGVASAIVLWASRRSWGRVGALAAGYALSVLAAWSAAGQDLDNLYPYVRRSVDLSRGYADSMGLDESTRVFLWGVAMGVLCAAFLLWAWRALADRAYAFCACGFAALSLFAMWKEGFTRADLVPLGGHVFGWFIYVLVLAPVLPGVLFPGRRLHWFDCAPLFCLLAFAGFAPEVYRWDLRVVWQRVYGNARALGHLGSLPQEWQAAYVKASGGAQLPRVQSAVGSGTVDVYDFNTDIALLNNLELDSRPIFQGYSAPTASLEGWNLRHYQSDKAPDFLLWNEDRIDNRYPGQDDALLLEALPGHLEPLFEEGGYWLFRRTSRIPAARPEQRVLLERTVRLSEEVVLPPSREQAIWLRADAVPSVLGRLRAFAYKIAELQIFTTDDRGTTRLWRVVPTVARDGFLLVPTLETAGDAALLMRGQTRSWIRSFHFEAAPGQGKFWSHVDLGVFAVPAIPLRLAGREQEPGSAN